jgi:hypothetical protein
MPVREYLFEHIFPHLTPGLLKVAQIRPDDPVQFLTNYIICEHAAETSKDDDIGEIDEEIVQEFKKLTQCDK